MANKKSLNFVQIAQLSNKKKINYSHLLNLALNEKVLFASQIGKKTYFTSATILKSFFKNPLMTFRVFFGIHYQALRIFFKGGRYYSRRKKPIDTISFEGQL